MDKIAITIANLGKEKGWSQTDLSDKSGVSREIIGKSESGKAVPLVDAAKKIDDAFVFRLDYLLDEVQNASFDRKTLDRLRDLELLEDSNKSTLFDIIDTYIRDAKARSAYTG